MIHNTFPHSLGDQDSEPVAAPLHGADEGALAPPDEADLASSVIAAAVAAVVVVAVVIGHVTVRNLGHFLGHVLSPLFTLTLGAVTKRSIAFRALHPLH